MFGSGQHNKLLLQASHTLQVVIIRLHLPISLINLFPHSKKLWLIRCGIESH
jgi:hypothetical protein